MPVYTNLFKFDLGDDSRVKNISNVSKETLSKIIEFHRGILSKEIEIIQPKIIIFFTLRIKTTQIIVVITEKVTYYSILIY